MEQRKPLKKITDQHLALVKAQSYCAYQERCQQEVRDKLYEWGLWPEAVENIIAELISANFINELRFSILFAGGKFRIKKWGRIKIISELKKRKITSYCINKALLEIKEEDYLNTLRAVIKQARKSIKKTTPLQFKYKLVRHAVAKGFEESLAWELLRTNKVDE